MHGIQVPLLLITAAVGYKVCAIASEKKGGLKKLGYTVGAVILIASFVSLGCSLYAIHCGGFMKYGGAMGGAAMPKTFCPIK